MEASLVSTVPIQATWWHNFAYTMALLTHTTMNWVLRKPLQPQNSTHTHKTDVVVGGNYNCLYTKWTMTTTQTQYPWYRHLYKATKS